MGKDGAHLSVCLGDLGAVHETRLGKSSDLSGAWSVEGNIEAGWAEERVWLLGSKSSSNKLRHSQGEASCPPLYHGNCDVTKVQLFCPGRPRSLNVDMEWLYGASESSSMEVDIGYIPQVSTQLPRPRT